MLRAVLVLALLPLRADASYHAQTHPPPPSPPGMCENTCPHTSDGLCSDGGPGTQTAQFCPLGTDCIDCGPRLMPPPPSPLPPALQAPAISPATATVDSPPPPLSSYLCIQGYWPLTTTSEESIALSPLGTFHEHTFHGTVYYMPDAFTGSLHAEPGTACPAAQSVYLSPSPPPAPPETLTSGGGGMSTGVIVGIVVGSVAGIAAVGCVAYAFFMRPRAPEYSPVSTVQFATFPFVPVRQ